MHCLIIEFRCQEGLPARQEAIRINKLGYDIEIDKLKGLHFSCFHFNQHVRTITFGLLNIHPTHIKKHENRHKRH